ncbi:MAG TPA: hypothetical protein VMK12_10980 [Anaeromyxobacteraceae bacterium]|nr:hypothetical protein [Anaeromyxobacteraceae bacterium]
MPRAAVAGSLDAAIRDAVRPIIDRLSKAVARSMEQAIALRVKAQVASSVRTKRGPGARRRRSTPKKELTRWVADRRARRVPTFVIELTGLDTKKKIVAKFGPDSVFEKGKAAPQSRAAAAEKASESRHPAPVKARPPIVRKAAAAGK